MRRSPSRALPARSWWRVKRSNKTPRAARQSPTGCVSSQRFRTFLSSSIKLLSKMRRSSDRRAWPSVAGALLTLKQADFHLRRIDRAHRRLLSSLKTLATIRRLALEMRLMGDFLRCGGQARTVSPVDVTAVRGSQLKYCVEVAAELLADVEELTVRSVHQAQRPRRESPIPIRHHIRTFATGIHLLGRGGGQPGRLERCSNARATTL